MELVAIGPRRLEGFLLLPAPAKAAILFAHGSGSSRHSRRNLYVAEHLAEAVRRRPVGQGHVERVALLPTIASVRADGSRAGAE